MIVVRERVGSMLKGSGSLRAIAALSNTSEMGDEKLDQNKLAAFVA